MLTQLLYISNHEGNVANDPKAFMAAARERNTKLGLSSILLATESNYLHLIEGHRKDVNALYNKISHDPKHKDCTLLRYIEVKAREFSTWHAEYVSLSEFDVDGMNLLTPMGPIDFEKITSAQAVTMIRRIHAHLQVTSSNRTRLPA